MPFYYFICGHGYHQLCINGDTEEIECSICKGKNNELTNKIEEGKLIASDPKKFFNELESNKEEKKFDIFAKYLGKGIFLNKHEEAEQKNEGNMNI